MRPLKTLLVAGLLSVLAACQTQATVNSPTTWTQTTITTLPQLVSVPFVFQAQSDLLVLDSVTSPPTVLTLNSDYTVSGGGGSTGTITVLSGGTHGVTGGDVITISRSVPLTQTTSFTASGPLNPQMIGNALDKLTMIAQQQGLVGANALQFPGDEVMSGVMDKTSRSGKVVGFDASGNLAFYDPSSGGGVDGPVTSVGVGNSSTFDSAFWTITVATSTTTPVITFTPKSVAAYSIWGNGTALGGISPNYYTVSQYLDAAVGSTQGTIAYRNASGWVALAPGTAGQVLTTNGSSQNPSWSSTVSQTVASTADFTVSATTTPADIPGLSVSLASGTTYSFEAHIICQQSSTGDYEVDVAGTATRDYSITNFIAIGGSSTAGTTYSGFSTGFSTGFAINPGGNNAYFDVKGTIVVSASGGGTFKIQFCQHTATGTSTAKRGSYLKVFSP